MILGIMEVFILIVGSLISSVGFWILFQKRLTVFRDQIRVESGIRSRNKRIRLERLGIADTQLLIVRWLAALTKELDFMLQNTKSNYGPSSVQNFLFFHISLFLSSCFLLNVMTHGYVFSIYISMILISINILRHRLKLRHMRLQAGYDLASVIGALANHYNSSNNPLMRNALQMTNEDINFPLFKKHFTNIIRVDQNYVDSELLKDAIDAFIYSIKTSFATELGATIFKSLRTKEHVGETLVRIDKKIHKNIEDIKEEIETKTDVKFMSWLHVIAFPLIFFVIVSAFRITKDGLLHFQFQTNTGKMMFSLSVASILLARLITSWFIRQPNDY